MFDYHLTGASKSRPGMKVIPYVMTPYGASKTGLPTTICINVFERQRRMGGGRREGE